MDRRGFAAIAILLIIAGALLIGGGLWYYESNKTTTFRTPTPEIVASSSVTTASSSILVPSALVIHSSSSPSLFSWESDQIDFSITSSTVTHTTQPNTTTTETTISFIVEAKNNQNQSTSVSLEDMKLLADENGDLDRPVWNDSVLIAPGGTADLHVTFLDTQNENSFTFATGASGTFFSANLIGGRLQLASEPTSD